MISKSKNLVAVFAALFLLLLGIQAYFLYKTYQLKEQQIYRTVQNKLTSFADRLEDEGGVTMITNDSMQHQFVEYKDGEITQPQFLNYFENNRIKNETFFTLFVDSQFIEEGYKVAAKIEFLSVVYTSENKSLLEKPVILYETLQKVTNPGTLTTGIWETSSTSTATDPEIAPVKNNFVVRSKTSYEILNIKWILFRELAFLIIVCVLILAAVLLLYIFTIKNLIRQQKEVEILHSVVDNISHEFKTPIATLKVASKALAKKWDPQTLTLVDRQIVRLEGLLSQLHADEKNKEIINVKSQDFDFIIEDLSFIYPAVQFDLQNQTLGEFPFDKNLMETVLKNLCENSVKYGGKNVEISISKLPGNLILEVSDDGSGIEKKEFENIFIKFYRIQQGNIHDTKGLGLGLYFVQKIVDQYKGKIEVRNVEPGTAFKITLPYEN